jgi:CheY-like chemotaxis protein
MKTVVTVFQTREMTDLFGRILGMMPDIEVVGDAYTGPNGLEVAKALEPDLLICHLRLKGLSGEELVHSFKEHCPSSKAIVITTLAEPEESVVNNPEFGALLFAPVSYSDIEKTLSDIDILRSDPNDPSGLFSLANAVGQAYTAVGRFAFFKDLPPDSWHIDVSSKEDELLVEFLRNDRLLREKSWHEIMDHPIWLSSLIPFTARVLNKKRGAYSSDLTIHFRSASEEDSWDAWVTTEKLIHLVESGEIDSPARVMSSLRFS